jgi:hypothetical protein
MVRTAVLIRCSSGESTYPPNRQMTIAIARITIAVTGFGNGLLLRTLVTANGQTSNAISIAPVPQSSQSRAASGQPALDYAEQRNVRDDPTEERG